MSDDEVGSSPIKYSQQSRLSETGSSLSEQGGSGEIDGMLIIMFSILVETNIRYFNS